MIYFALDEGCNICLTTYLFMKKKYALIVILVLVNLAALAGEYRDADTSKPELASTFSKNKNLDSNALVVLDGKIIGTFRESEVRNTMSSLLPEQIKSVNILKDSIAVTKYGPQGKAGVIDISMKEEHIKDISITEVPGDYDVIFDKVEIEASFPGGNQAWRKYLERNVNGSVPADNNAPTGIYTVIVQFIVDKQGYISDIRPLTKNGYGTEEEVIKAIKKGPRWTPAIQNGRIVKAYRKQPVTFHVEDDIITVYTKEQYVLNQGVSTPVSIKVEKVKDEDLEITIDGGTISRISEGNYEATVDKPGTTILTIRDKKKNKEIGKVTFTVR